ncbi:MAG TPA: SRPBCC family protein [Actinomycetota bacterium]|nr:SRPBCC family protein [Actinomycetota bacterium]
MRLVTRAWLPGQPEALWSLLTDWERQASWMPDVAWVRVLGPERGLGAWLEVRTRVIGLPFLTDRLRVTAWDPPRRLAVRHEGVVRGSGEWLLEPLTHGTRLTWTEDLHLPGPLDALLRWYRPVLLATFRRSLRALARLAAQPPASPG